MEEGGPAPPRTQSTTRLRMVDQSEEGPLQPDIQPNKRRLRNTPGNSDLRRCRRHRYSIDGILKLHSIVKIALWMSQSGCFDFTRINAGCLPAFGFVGKLSTAPLLTINY